MEKLLLKYVIVLKLNVKCKHFTYQKYNQISEQQLISKNACRSHHIVENRDHFQARVWVNKLDAAIFDFSVFQDGSTEYHRHF